MHFVFQFTLPRGERPTSRTVTVSVRSFNSRSHAGSDRNDATGYGAKLVSIHAPTRGATT